MPIRAAVIVLALVPFMTGCAMNRIVANNMIPTMDDQKTSFYKETSVRHALAAAPALLKLLDGFIVSSPENEKLLSRAAELNCGFAMLLIEDEDPEWAAALYLKGYDYAMRALEKRLPGVGAKLTGSAEDFSSALAPLGPEDVNLVFWAGDCLGGWMNLNRHDVTALAELSRVVAFAEKALELDETFFWGGPHMFLGYIHGSVGTAVGGLPEKSREHFHKAFEISSNTFLLAKVYYANTYCIQVQDRACFETALQEVLDAPADVAPDLGLVTAASRQKAQILLDKVDDLFIE